MVSVLRLASLPQRLQLVALVLVLGAGLLPGKFVAAEEAPAPVVDEGDGVTPAQSNDSRSSNSSNTAVGRADGSTAGGIRCYVQHQCNGPRSQCMLTAEYLNKSTCEGAYCYQQIEETDDGQMLVYRACATREEVFCLSRQPGGCVILSDKDERKNTKSCMSVAARAPRHGRQSSSETSSNSTKGENMDVNVDASGKAERCICDTDLCNIRDSISSAFVGVKHLGCNFALLGVSLVAIFPLQSMCRVG